MTYKEFKTLGIYECQEIHLRGTDIDEPYVYISCKDNLGKHVLYVRNEYGIDAIPLTTISHIRAIEYADESSETIEDDIDFTEFDFCELENNDESYTSREFLPRTHTEVEEFIIKHLLKKINGETLSMTERLALVKVLFPSEVHRNCRDSKIHDYSLVDYFSNLFDEMNQVSINSLSKSGKRAYYKSIQEKSQILYVIGSYISGYKYSNRRLVKQYRDNSYHTDKKGNKKKRQFNQVNFSKVIKESLDSSFSDCSDIDIIESISEKNGCRNQNYSEEDKLVEKTIDDFLLAIKGDMEKKVALHLFNGNTKTSAEKEFGLSPRNVRTIVEHIEKDIKEYLHPTPPITSKVCKVCGKEKLLSEFTKNSRRKDKLETFCRDCGYNRKK